MSELARRIDRYLEELARANQSPHTIEAYGSDLRQFLAYLSPPGLEPPEPPAIDTLIVREWLARLYADRLSTVAIRRKLAALRGLFAFLLREGVVSINVARLVRTPKAPKTLPDVPTPEQVNTMLDAVPRVQPERPFPERDRAIFEMLYGCGLRVSELVGIDLEDLYRTERWIRVRGKGRKERQVPFTGKAAEALERYLAVRPVARDQTAVFLNYRRGRLSARAVHGLVKLYAAV
ncbi:MAG: tyrosine-type recombinase/integrase, partial [Burkholderiales bacterium]|nr:tyrosine-type recombinase/integrase [Burkholderiales bacterium]